MRLNKYIASRSSLSRRAADTAISQGRVTINDQPAQPGTDVTNDDTVRLDGKQLNGIKTIKLTILFNKPKGYVCSRNGQGSNTIYDILPEKYRHLNPAGRLDKNSSGLLLLTNDGNLANELTHPSYRKTKIYEIQIDKDLSPLHQQMISDNGIMLEDGVSKLSLEKLQTSKNFKVVMHEGRTRQIRRTFEALGYEVAKLHRTNFGPYSLANIGPGKIQEI